MKAIPYTIESDPIIKSKTSDVEISPFSLKEDQLIQHCCHRKQAKISSNEKIDFFLTPVKIPGETTPRNMSTFKRRLFTDLEEDTMKDSFQMISTPMKTKRTYSETTLVNRQISDNKKYLNVQKKLIEQGMNKSPSPLDIELTKNLEHPDISTIEPTVLQSLIQDPKQPLIILDTRFNFEYEAGHIKGSINVTNPFHLENLFFENGHLLFSKNFLRKLPEFSEVKRQDLEKWLKRENEIKSNHENLLTESPIIVIHCEFSQKRGPKLLRYMRKRDREINEEHYPNLIYPNIFLLNGGYSNFVKQHSDLCTENGGYISMFNENFKMQCSLENNSYNKVWGEITSTKFITNFY